MVLVRNYPLVRATRHPLLTGAPVGSEQDLHTWKKVVRLPIPLWGTFLLHPIHTWPRDQDMGLLFQKE